MSALDLQDLILPPTETSGFGLEAADDPHLLDTGSVLFVDITGFTGIAEGMAPARLMTWVGEFLRDMAAVVGRHGGFVDKLMGDGLMAVFLAGARDHADAAMDAAEAMHAALTELNDRFRMRGLPQIRMRIGVHSGALVTGFVVVGSDLATTTVGDTVNTASRLQSLELADESEGATRILCSAATAERLRPARPMELVGTLNLRGKHRPVTVYRLRVGRDAQ